MGLLWLVVEAVEVELKLPGCRRDKNRKHQGIMVKEELLREKTEAGMCDLDGNTL